MGLKGNNYYNQEKRISHDVPVEYDYKKYLEPFRKDLRLDLQRRSLLYELLSAVPF